MTKSIAAYGPLYKTRGPERGVKRFPTGIAGLDKKRFIFCASAGHPEAPPV